MPSSDSLQACFPLGNFRELCLCFAVEAVMDRRSAVVPASTRPVFARGHVAGGGFFCCIGEMRFATFLSAESSGGRCVCNGIHDVC